MYFSLLNLNKSQLKFPPYDWQRNEMSNELVVEAEDSAPMSEACARAQMDAIQEDEEEQE